MSIYTKTTIFVDNISKRLTDAKKATAIKEYILNLDCKDNTKSGLITKIKTYVKDKQIFKDNNNINLLNAPEIYNKIFEKVNKDRAEKKSLNIDMNIINQIFNLKCDKVLKSNGEYENNLYSLYAYLLATSGLRTNELWDNSFDIVSEYIVKPTRISKKEYNDDDIIKLLIPAKIWIKYFDILHQLITEKNLKYGSTIFTGIKRKLLPIHPELTGHTLRKIYLSYHKQILKTDADKLPSIRTKKLLNHTSENTSTYYNDAVNITGNLIDVIDRTDYTKMKVAELKAVLTSKNIPFKSKTNKIELLKLLSC